MRKNKTWEISLTNNSRLVANEPIDNAVVYTTDTEAYLNFRVIDSGFEFDGATIAMLNKDDGSIVERPMTKEDDTAVYEIESDIIPHFGLWQAQVLFKQGEEVFTSTPVTFVIERYMMAEQPPRLEDVVNWQKLYENATETIQELNRINDELANTNQIVEQAEAQRASTESSRVSAEEQREIDHANRSAELAGKADKVAVRNLIENGDFSNGTTDWGSQDTVIAATNNTLTGTGLGNIPFLRIFSGDNNRKLLGVTGNKVYGRALMRVSDDVGTGIDMRIQNITVNYARVSSLGNPRKGVWENVSDVVSLPSNANGIQLGVAFHAYYANRSEQLNKTLDVRYSMLIDLTATFGAGNEPNKEEMDELIEITGYIDNEYALNNKEMLIWTLALIRRNKNAIITLGGA